MGNKNEINIVYCLSEVDYLSTLVSVQSVIANNSNNFINFYFILDEQFEKEFLKVFGYIEKYSFCKIHFVYESRKKYLNILNRTNFSENFYIFNIADLINVGKVIYLSSQTLVNCDLAELFSKESNTSSCFAAEYIYPQILDELFNVKKEQVLHSTVLLIDLVKWKRENYFSKLQSINYEQYTKEYKPDFGVVFNLLVSSCDLLDYTYNYTEANSAWFGDKPLNCSKTTKDLYKNMSIHLEKPKIITFCGECPLGFKVCNNSYTSLWWKYAEQSPIYREIKEFRQLNKYKLSATSAQNSFKYTWLLSRIFPYIKPYIPRILIGFAIAIPLGLLDGVTAFALKPYMDYVIGGKTLEFSLFDNSVSINSMQMAFLIPAGVILFAIIQGVFRYINDYISAWTSQRITNDVKFDLFHRLIHMHPQFFDDNPSGIVISRYMGDPGTASAGIVEQIKTITTSLFGALGLIAVMLYSSWQLAFIGVLVLCIAFVPVALIRKRIKEASNKNMVIGGNITTNINETYSGNKVMAAYDLQDRQESYFKEQTWKSFNINMALTKRAAWMSPLMYLIASCGIAVVLGYGTYLINRGSMTSGAFASFVTSLLLLYKPVKTLGGTLTGIQNIFVAMGRVFELFDLEPAIKDCENPKNLEGLENKISFEDVVFEYVPNNPVLNGLSLVVPKNETLAIVGNSGGGKSTLVNLIPRFYDIKSGAIKIDDVDIRNYSLKSLRRCISMVFQDNFLYSDTIKENIMMGNPDASVEELMEAIKSAHLQDMIQELPDGLDTVLGERGLTLSGGQRQRVAIARAMLKNAPIVILDEATSALDNESEAIVQKAMDNLMKDRTVFIIAHRLSTIKNADRIAVINEGNLVELGTHDELMQIENGQYKALYEMQFKKKEAAVIS